MEKVWEIKDPDLLSRNSSRKRASAEDAQSAAEEKDPARAYSRSILLWGSGQNYNGEYGKGLALKLLLIAIVLGVGLSLFFHDALLHYLKTAQIPFADAFLAAEILLLCVLLVSVGNAGDAYRSTAKTRRTRFRGTSSKIFPCLGSLLLPGWGQFLNGQPFKGALFSAVGTLGIFSLVSIPAVLFSWPSLEETSSRFIIEGAFAISIASAPAWSLFWLFSVYDALRISLDEYKKEPLLVRIKAANNRRRTAGLFRGVFPWIGRMSALALVLAICEFLVSRNFPLGYYVKSLTLMRRELTRLGMTILPELITKLLPLLSGK